MALPHSQARHPVQMIRRVEQQVNNTFVASHPLSCAGSNEGTATVPSSPRRDRRRSRTAAAGQMIPAKHAFVAVKYFSADLHPDAV